jgi:ATP-binding cassette subfamily C protein LapB
VAILIGATLYIQPRMKKISESAFEDGQNKHSVLVETLSGLETVKLLGAGGLLRRKFKAVLHRQAAISEQTKKHTYFATNLTAEVQQAVQIAVVAVGAVAVSQASSGYGAIIACTILSGKALAPFAQVSQLLLRLNQVVTGYKALDALMQQPAEHDKSVSYLPRGDIEGSVSFKEVTFSYPLQDGKALDRVTFEINPGERVAIVGRVGSGKTTIGKLTAKLFNPESGSIYIGGVDLLQLDPAEIRENIGYVSQEPWLIAGTIEQNITLGANEVTTEDLIWAARLSGAAEFIDAHPKGYKLAVRERGEGISGGQKQCITIARALVRRPKILIFDEPTSSMDVRTEKIFIDSFRKQKFDSTLILITHRTSLLALVDRVLVVDSGKILGTESTSSFLSKSVKPSKNLSLDAMETSKSKLSSQVS